MSKQKIVTELFEKSKVKESILFDTWSPLGCIADKKIRGYGLTKIHENLENFRLYSSI